MKIPGCPSILLLLLLIPLSWSCRQSPETTYNRDGISFVSPSGWALEEEAIDEESYFVTTEKEGWNSSGLFTISWAEGFLGLELWLDIYQEEIKSNIIYRNSDIAFQPTVDGSYNGYPTRSSRFTANLLGMPHKGVVHALEAEGKTIVILIQEATEDHTKNAPGFQTIEKSFRVD